MWFFMSPVEVLCSKKNCQRKVRSLQQWLAPPHLQPQTPAATPAASPTGTGAVGALRGLGGLVAAAAHSAVHAVESAAHATEMLLGETHVAAAHKKEQEHAHHESALPNSLGFLGCRCVWIACRESDENWPARFRSR